MHRVLGRQVISLLAVLAVSGTVAGCHRGPASTAPTVHEARPAAITPRLDHLRALGLDVKVKGKPQRALALYANAPDYKPAASPERDGSEGIACVDDAARGVVVYLRDYEVTRDPRSRDDAKGLLDFITSMESGNGEFVNFIRFDGSQNETGITSKSAFSYWAARALWALGEAERVLRPHDPALADNYRPFLDRAVARFGVETGAGKLTHASGTATAEALLGLLAYQRAAPSADRAALAYRVALTLACAPAAAEGACKDAAAAEARPRQDDQKAPWGGTPDEEKPPSWHAWGDRNTEAIARAGAVLGKPELAQLARREADALWTRELLAQVRASSVTAAGKVDDFPQISYGLSPVIGGLLALADATGDRAYASLAGLHAEWFFGANPGGIPLYDEASGRSFDGVDAPGKVNKNAGAESTVEALLALEAVAADPDATLAARLRPEGAPTSLERPGSTRVFASPSGGASLALTYAGGPVRFGETVKLERRAASGDPITLTYWPAANPIEVALANRLATAFNEQNPGVRVQVQPIPAGRSSEEVLLAAIVAKATPDICSNISSTLVARLARANGVVRLDTLPDTAARLRERADGAMIAPARLDDGGIYAFPWKTNPLMLLYNVGQLRAAGIAAPPRTHSELLEASRKLVRDVDGDGRADHWALWATLKTTWFERFYDVYPTYLAASGGRTLLDHGKVVFDDDAMVDAFELFRQGFAKGYFPRTNFEGTDPFIDGTVAMKIIGPWFLEQLDKLKVPGLEYDVTPIPVPDGPKLGDAYAFGDWKSIAVFSTSTHPEEAARFVAFLTSPEADRQLIELSAQLPYRRGLATDPRFAPAIARWKALGPYAALVERSRDLDASADAVEVLDVLSESYEASAIFGKRTSREAVHAAAEEAKELLRVH